MKRFTALLLALAMLLLMASCGTPVQPTDPSDSEPSQDPTGSFSTESTGDTEGSTPSDPSETQPEDTEPPVVEPKLIFGDVYITTSTPLSAEYTEATVSVQWEGGSIEAQTVKIKHRGNLSLTHAEKKSYNIKFEEKVSLMGMDEGKKWSLLANHFDKSLLRATIGFEYAAKLDLPYVSQTQLCRVWLDGQYRGIYTIIEPVEEGKKRVDLDLDTGDFMFERNSNTYRVDPGVTYFLTNSGMRFEMNEPEEPTPEELADILAVLNEIEASIISMDHTQYEQYINVDSFVDYFILQELIKDIDYGAFSARYFVKDGILNAGPPWDMDLTMGNVSLSHFETKYHLYHNIKGEGNGSGDSTQGHWAPGKDFYIWLAEDPYFMDLVKARWQELKPITDNIVMDNELGQARIDWYLQEGGAMLESNYTAEGAGWPVAKPNVNLEYSYPAKDYAGNVELLKQWLIGRIAWLDSRYGAQAEETP